MELIAVALMTILAVVSPGPNFARVTRGWPWRPFCGELMRAEVALHVRDGRVTSSRVVPSG